jgi:hypothetical protein
MAMIPSRSTLRDSYVGRRPGEVGEKAFVLDSQEATPVLFGEVGLQLYRSDSADDAQRFWLANPPERVYINDAPGLPGLTEQEAREFANRERLSLDSFPDGTWRATCLSGASIADGVCGAFFFWTRLCTYNLEILLSVSPNDLVNEAQAGEFARQTRQMVAERVGCNDSG